jgi:hypothetical protein
MADVVNRGTYAGDPGADSIYECFGDVNTEFAKDLGTTKIHAATEKATPVDADEFGYADSADNFKLKRISWAAIKYVLLTYFDTVYSKLTLGTSSITAHRGDYGTTAYNHSQATHAPAGAQANADITKAEIEAKLTGEISSHTHALNLGGYSFNVQTGTTYTFVLADDGKMVRANNASAQTYTIPPNSSVAFSEGSVITIEQTGAGIITVAPGSGVTINSTARKTWGQYSTIQIYKISTDVWNVIGGTV